MGNHGTYEAQLTFANATLLEIFSIGWDNPFWEIESTDVDEETGEATIVMYAEGKMFDFISHPPDSAAFWRSLRIVSALMPNVWKILTRASIYSYSYDGVSDEIGVDYNKALLTPEQVAKVMATAEEEGCDFDEAMTEWVNENECYIWEFFNYNNLADYLSPWGYVAEIELTDGELQWDCNDQDWECDWRELAKDYHVWLGECIDEA
tara:strand:+ start:313 stop:933 length:621 start_codon:yes stop_codon:yes gene_type:complete